MRELLGEHFFLVFCDLGKGDVVLFGELLQGCCLQGGGLCGVFIPVLHDPYYFFQVSYDCSVDLKGGNFSACVFFFNAVERFRVHFACA